MLVKKIMKTKPVTIKTGTGYREVAEILLNNRISGAPVINASGDMVGVVSEKDLFRALYPTYGYFYTSPEEFVDFERLEKEAREAGDKKVEEFMSARLITTTPETSVLKVGALMIATGIHRVPVVDENNKLIGMVSRGDIYRAIMREHFDLWEETDKSAKGGKKTKSKKSKK